jgi:hypothetical protein
MTDRTRASIFGDEPDFDVSDFQPAKPTRRVSGPNPEAVAAVSGAAGFSSREPISARTDTRRAWRTGRNVQFNVKAKPETIERFREIADKEGWSIAVVLERALEALDRELTS